MHIDYSNLCEAEEFNCQCPSSLFNAVPYHDVVMDASINEENSVVSDSDLSQHDLPFVSDVVSQMVFVQFTTMFTACCQRCQKLHSGFTRVVLRLLFYVVVKPG